MTVMTDRIGIMGERSDADLLAIMLALRSTSASSWRRLIVAIGSGFLVFEGTAPPFAPPTLAPTEPFRPLVQREKYRGSFIPVNAKLRNTFRWTVSSELCCVSSWSI